MQAVLTKYQAVAKGYIYISCKREVVQFDLSRWEQIDVKVRLL